MTNTLKSSTQTTKNIKLLVFKIGHLSLAFQIEAVEKVINYTPIHGSGLTHLGIAHVGEEEITVIDLHKKLLNTSQSYQEGYLMMLENSLGESFGILVEDTPSLMEVPLSNLRVLPESYRNADTLAIASHVTVVQQDKEQVTIFLLDVDKILFVE